MPDRLQRLPQIFAGQPIYFVTTCTHGRQKILATEKVHQRLQDFATAGPEHGAWLGAFVLMPDHLHAFVTFDDNDSARLGSWMRLLKNALSKTLKEQGYPAPHWQKGYFDHVLRSGESYAGKWLYVWNNPVRAGLVEKAENWPYFGQPFPVMMPQPKIDAA